ncbi:hypothetical protein O1Q96_01620 (plasmid) [Streptomyces sp. Qhu-G9]|uniref:VMAP-C domain-containing protein n=1 Tax=Streptomyces sp. Qhu-G9 TaxID=3452799 RepID=UPI0022AC5AB7|nr:hypothetical protein [Streptomyces aurantiacus]WAU78549.1 hypothetical protein O1Q96_01620 [Streptomyces aurantiacus]
MGTSRDLGISAAKLLGAVASTVLLEQAMIRLLEHSEGLGKPAARRALLRHLAFSVPPAPREASATDELAKIVHGCAQNDQTGEKTDSLTRAVLAVTGDREMVSQLRLLSDLNLAHARLPQDELSALHTMLRDCALDVNDVARSALAPFPPRLPDHCTNAWSVTLHLMRRNTRPDGLPPFLAFLEHAAASLTDPDAQRQLQRWNLAYAQARGLEKPLKACRSSARPSSRHTRSIPEHRIMVVLLPDGLDEDYCTLRVWHQHDQTFKDDDVLVRQSDLQRVVRQRLAHWTAQKTPRQILVEFWLGLSLINLPVMHWCVPEEDLQEGQTRMRVVVRSMGLRPDDTRDPWRAHWSGLIGQDPTARRALCPAGKTADLPARRPLILAESPASEAGRAQLLEALHQGVAAVMWDRSNTDVQQFRTYAEILFDEVPPAQLPMRLNQVQSARDGSPQAEALHDAVLIWDDPDRDLPEPSPLTSPDEVSAR